MEELLNLGDTFRREIDHFVLFIDDEISRFFSLDAHDRIDLGQVFHVFAAFHLLGQNIAGLVDLGGLAALTGNNKRCARLVDQDRVDLVDDGVMKFPKDQVLLVDRHVIAQIIKTEFIVGNISNVAAVGLLPLLAAHAVENNTDSKSHKLVDLTHPFRVTFGQVIVDSDYMYTSAFQSIEVGGHGCHKSFTFTGTHLRDTALMQDNAADQLNTERLHSQ